ncbi:carboxypeptidase-like regulatory domain-containing protein, partial [Muriicola sp.]|uniref:carboxypeptidase-like regulatory domain-containing protein n=1 Tax=Muriicola sp. TaxID=2020856 RepID=UPI003C76A0A8
MKIQLTLLLLLCGFISWAQNSLEGSILNSETMEPLEEVSVYFPQLEKGAITDKQGNYQINNVPLGSYKFIASYIGYLTYSSTLDIQSGVNSLNILLTPSAIEMQEVIVSTPFHKLQRENVMKVEQEKMADLRTNGAITLADGIRSIAGVESVSTGIGIAKPVIRGLCANRVLVYTQG